MFNSSKLRINLLVATSKLRLHSLLVPLECELSSVYNSKSVMFSANCYEHFPSLLNFFFSCQLSSYLCFHKLLYFLKAQS